ncbi:hypothetical protein E2C01_030792 [Portunus trituberculatus]|uniref:Uncharacterized protein n=1 Tax=Portunus trituberculatus TaxID=210409 RepID=A0A5B7EWB6_PORTR|nr:hypothetical protein [Portunus trituberculatus]
MVGQFSMSVKGVKEDIVASNKTKGSLSKRGTDEAPSNTNNYKRRTTVVFMASISTKRQCAVGEQCQHPQASRCGDKGEWDREGWNQGADCTSEQGRMLEPLRHTPRAT